MRLRLHPPQRSSLLDRSTYRGPLSSSLLRALSVPFSWWQKLRSIRSRRHAFTDFTFFWNIIIMRFSVQETRKGYHPHHTSNALMPFYFCVLTVHVHNNWENKSFQEAHLRIVGNSSVSSNIVEFFKGDSSKSIFVCSSLSEIDWWIRVNGAIGML